MAAETTAKEAGEAADGQRSPDVVDRLLVGISGAIWLVLLAVGVIAAIALVGLGRGRSGTEASESPWVLYTVIAISSVTLLGAIPLLIRARRGALADPAGEAPASAPASAPAAAATATPVREPAVEAPTEKLRVFGTVVDRPAKPEPQPDTAQPGGLPAGPTDRVLLRCAASIFAAMGLALIGVATATYLLAVGSDTAAWVAIGFAAVITAAMPAVSVFFQRQLGGVSGRDAPE